jgi:hypothetical protein
MQIYEAKKSHESRWHWKNKVVNSMNILYIVWFTYLFTVTDIVENMLSYDSMKIPVRCLCLVTDVRSLKTYGLMFTLKTCYMYLIGAGNEMMKVFIVKSTVVCNIFWL